MADRQIDAEIILKLDKAAADAVAEEIARQFNDLSFSVSPQAGGGGGTAGGGGGGGGPVPGAGSSGFDHGGGAGGGGGFWGGGGSGGGGPVPGAGASGFDHGGGEWGDGPDVEPSDGTWNRFYAMGGRHNEMEKQRHLAAFPLQAANWATGQDPRDPLTGTTETLLRGEFQTGMERRRSAAWAKEMGIPADEIASVIKPPGLMSQAAKFAGASVAAAIGRPGDTTKEDRVMDMGEAFSFGNLSGVGNPMVDGRREGQGSDPWSFMPELRMMGEAQYGAINPDEATQVRHQYAQAVGGFAEPGQQSRTGANLHEALMLRMAGVDVGASGNYRSQFLPGMGGVGAESSDPMGLAGALQGAGMGGGEISQILREIASNTGSLAQRGIQTDVAEQERFIKGMLETPGMEGVGRRAGVFAAGIQNLGARGQNSLFSGMSEAADAAMIAEAVAQAEDPSDPLSVEKARARIAGTSQGVIGAMRNQFGGNEDLMAYVMADPSSGIPGSIGEIQAAARGVVNPSGRGLTTARDVAERHEGGVDPFGMRETVSDRRVSEVGRAMTPSVFAAAQSLEKTMDSLREAVRDLGGILKGGGASVMDVLKRVGAQ